MHLPVHNPARVTKLTDVADALERWDRVVSDYVKIGGKDVDEDEKITIALQVLPKNTPASMLLALRNETSYEALKAALAEQITFLDDHGGINSGNAHAVMPDAWEPEDKQHNEECEDEAEVLACLSAEQLAQLASLPNDQQSSVLAIMRKFGKGKGKGKGGKGKGNSKGGGRPSTPPMTGARAIKCANCGRDGHTSRECRGAVVTDAL